MKYIVILCDGMADEPLEELGGRTPLEAAETGNMDRLAADSEIGMVRKWEKKMCLSGVILLLFPRRKISMRTG